MAKHRTEKSHGQGLLTHLPFHDTLNRSFSYKRTSSLLTEKMDQQVFTTQNAVLYVRWQRLGDEREFIRVS